MLHFKTKHISYISVYKFKRKSDKVKTFKVGAKFIIATKLEPTTVASFKCSTLKGFITPVLSNKVGSYTF